MAAAARPHLVPSTHTDPTRPPSRTKAVTAPHPAQTLRAPAAHRAVTVMALLSAAVVFVVAMLTSAASLYEIAVDSELAAPWGLPVVLDLLATASAAVAWVTRSWGARLAAAAAFATSLGLQVGHVWGEGPTVWVVHSAAPVGAVVMFEVALILAGRAAPLSAPHVEAEAEPASATPDVAPALVKPAALVAVAPVVRPAPARKAPARKAVPAKATDDQLADAAVALERANPGTVLTGWQACAAALRADGWKFGNDRIRNTVLDLARTRAQENADA